MSNRKVNVCLYILWLNSNLDLFTHKIVIIRLMISMLKTIKVNWVLYWKKKFVTPQVYSHNRCHLTGVVQLPRIKNRSKITMAVGASEPHGTVTY